jgi:DNA-binding MurR/RpiR family transcriptional regulator
MCSPISFSPSRGPVTRSSPSPHLAARANIVRALEWARGHGLRTIALTGFDGGEARRVAEVAIHVHGTNYGVIEDLHQAVMHALAQYIRQSRMTSAAISSNVF